MFECVSAYRSIEVHFSKELTSSYIHCVDTHNS